MQDTKNEPKQRTLAASALAHDDEALAALDLKGGAIEHPLLFELQMNIAHLEDMGIGRAHVGKKTV